MGKYDPLTHHLAQSRSKRLPMSFNEIEKLLGFPLPHSSRTHRAWWSNNPSNNVMTKAWLAAGYESADVDVEGGHLVFRKRQEGGPAPSAPAASPSGSPNGLPLPAHVTHPAFGAMKGLLKVAPDVDLTQPADPEWGQP